MDSAINPMASALQQMQTMASAAASTGSTASVDDVAGSGDFASMLKSSLDKVNATQQTAASEAKAF